MPLAYRPLHGLQAEDLLRVCKALFVEYNMDVSKLLTFTADGASVSGVRRCQTSDYAKKPCLPPSPSLQPPNIFSALQCSQTAALRWRCFYFRIPSGPREASFFPLQVFVQTSKQENRLSLLVGGDGRTFAEQLENRKEQVAFTAETITEAVFQLDHSPCTFTCPIQTLLLRP